MTRPTFTLELLIGTTWTDISCDVMDATWSLGYVNDSTNIPMPSRATFRVRNHDGKYSPERTADCLTGLNIGLSLRLSAVYGGTTTRLYTAWIERINPEPFLYKGDKTARIETHGYLARAQYAPVAPEIQLNKRAEELLEYLLTHTAIVPPGTDDAWLLGVGGYSELEETTYLGGTASLITAETGVETFPYAFDDEPEDSRLYDMLKHIIDSEQGWLYEGRDGKLVFLNQNHFYVDTTLDETFDRSMFDMDYTYGANLYNAVQVQYNPRKLETAAAPYTLATLDQAMGVNFGETVTFTMAYKSDENEQVSTTDPIEPVRNTHWTAHENDDGTGTDPKLYFTVTAVHSATGSEWTVTNSHPTKDGYLDAGAIQTANNKLTSFGTQITKAMNQDSIVAYGYRPIQINAPLLPTAAEASRVANIRLAGTDIPLGDITSVTFTPYRNATLLAAAITRTIGDRIKIIEPQTGVSTEYFIIGEDHKSGMGFADWRVTWHLMNVRRYLVWTLGVAGWSELGETTFLG